jgi:hypothetical protein
VKTVYVALLDEGTDCWRPVQAEHMSGDVYRLCGPKHEDEAWEFQPGELVRCKPRRFSGGAEEMAAFEKVSL